MVRYAIVDDEGPGRINLRLALGAYPDWTQAAEADGVAAARAVLAGLDIDVIFLDVRMPAESGLVLARELCQHAEPPLIIFVTAYAEHAVEAFDVHALDYLVKPLNDARLAHTVERAEAMLAHRQRAAYGAAVRDYVDSSPAARPEHFHVRSVGRIEQISVSDIQWVESAGNYVELHLDARVVLHRITLNQLETLLPPDDFVRVHRGAMVRRGQIASLEATGDGTYRLSLRDGAQVAVSKRYLAALKASM